jgi:hypothetical protein
MKSFFVHYCAKSLASFSFFTKGRIVRPCRNNLKRACPSLQFTIKWLPHGSMALFFFIHGNENPPRINRKSEIGYGLKDHRGV